MTCYGKDLHFTLFCRYILREVIIQGSKLFNFQTKGAFLSTFAKLRKQLRGSAGKSLARPNFRCRVPESIVSLERGVCSCAELQVFSFYRGWKEAFQATRAISATSRGELPSSIFVLSRQGVERNSRHSDRYIRGTCTMVRHRQKLSDPV